MRIFISFICEYSLNRHISKQKKIKKCMCLQRKNLQCSWKLCAIFNWCTRCGIYFHACSLFSALVPNHYCFAFHINSNGPFIRKKNTISNELFDPWMRVKKKMPSCFTSFPFLKKLTRANFHFFIFLLNSLLYSTTFSVFLFK